MFRKKSKRHCTVNGDDFAGQAPAMQIQDRRKPNSSSTIKAGSLFAKSKSTQRL
jgi:hypothetical protein